MLLARGANPSLGALIRPDASLRSVSGIAPPIHLAATTDQTEMLQLLLAAGADPNQPDEQTTGGPNPRHFPPMTTALLEAAESGHLEAVQILIAAGADPDCVRGECDEFTGESAVFMAVSRKHTEVVRALLDGGADATLPRLDGLAPIALAAGHETPEILTLLLNAGVDPSTSQGGHHETGWTPLHYTAMNGRQRSAALLLERGADREAETANETGHFAGGDRIVSVHSGALPFEVAEIFGHAAIAEMLEVQWPPG